MEDYLKCSKCPDSDQEGQFCRCEDRNIRIAKERRDRGKFRFFLSKPDEKDLVPLTMEEFEEDMDALMQGFAKKRPKPMSK